jgi:hypothetical protein
MWFAGMTEHKAVYVFNWCDKVILHAKEFVHLIPGAFEINDGNVRSNTSIRRFSAVVHVLPQDSSSLMLPKSCIWYGFNGSTMEDAIQQLVDSFNCIQN